MSARTIGQICFDAWNSEPRSPPARRWELAGSAILEAAAQVAEQVDPKAHDIAARIRKLKSI